MFIASVHVIKTTRQRAAATGQSINKLIKKRVRTWIISRPVLLRSEIAPPAFYVDLIKRHGTQKIGWNPRFRHRHIPTSAIDAGEWSTSGCDVLIPSSPQRYEFDSTTAEPRGRSLGQDTNLLSSSGIEHRFLSLLARRLVTEPTEKSI